MPDSLPVRELYCPSHFGNSYEVALPREMGDLLSEARFWGFNRFADWFDTIDLYDVYRGPHRLYNMPEAMWERKFSNFTVAGKLGLDLSLVITPNHVFSDQVTPQNEAVKGEHVFGQLVCPSKPGVTEMIVRNYRNLFEDFARRGLKLRSLEACPYDYGGCDCDACKPWIVAFGKLYREIALAAKEVFGEIEAGLIGWWWSDEDHKAFTEWADREAPGLFPSFAHYILYGTTSYPQRPIPQGTRDRAFVHIGYGEKGGLDVYGHWGAPIAPTRIETTVRELFARGAEGYCAYSEGICDDVNKALLAGLSSGQYARADEVLQAYAERYLGPDIEGWAQWLRSMGDVSSVNPAEARKLFDRLAQEASPSWRLEQLDLRLVMTEADAEVRRHAEWNSERMAAAERFWAAKERLYRWVWRLGLLRHIFRFEANAPDWYTGYLQARGQQDAAETRIRPDA